MPERHRALLLVLGLVAEATWITAALAVLGLGLTEGRAVIPWWAVFAVLAGAVALGASAPQYAHRDGEHLDGGWRRLQAAAGGLGLYLCLAASPASGAGSGSVLWPLQLMRGGYSGLAATALVLAGFAALFVWRRGVRIGLEGLTRTRLQDTFRYGTLTIGLAALVDRGCGCGLLSPELIAVFFAAVLGALALGQIVDAGGQSTMWLRLTGLTVLAVLLGGAAIGQAGSTYGIAAVSAAGEVWRAMVTAFVDLLALVLGPVLEALFELMEWLKSRISGDRFELRPSRGIGRIEVPEGIELSAFASTLRLALQLVLLALVGWLLYRGLRFSFRSHYRLGLGPAGTRREAVESEDGALADLAGLLAGLLPRWLRPALAEPPGWRLPDGAPPGVRDAFRLYFDMLDAAAAHGWRFDPQSTPLERIARLEATLHPAPVAEITRRFNAACYGREPTDPVTLEGLRAELSRR